jgi:hypothetical protein
MLVLKAARWLTNQGYCPVLSEFNSSISEIPDAVGWRNNTKLLDRSQFLAESRDKAFRRKPEDGVGKFRYFSPSRTRDSRSCPAGDATTDPLSVVGIFSVPWSGAVAARLPE